MSETPSLPRPLGSPEVPARFSDGFASLKARSESLRSFVAPGETVLLLHHDGAESIWRGGSRLPDVAGIKKPKFVAVQVPEDLVLRRSLVLPRMSELHRAEALLLEVRSNSPFPEEDLAWGSLVREMDGGRQQVDLVITSRRHLAGFLRDRWPELAAAARQPELWAWSGQDSPVVIQGYGEIHRLHDAAVGRRWNWALAGVALALATMAAITPTIQLRMRALEAVDAMDAVMRRVAPLVRKRDELAVLNDQVRALDLIAAERVDPAGVMEHLTRILPDDTYLYGLDVQKTKITASGHTVDASAVLQKLSLDPRLKNVRAPMAVTRQFGATKEAFVIEFIMEPRVAAGNPAPVAAAVIPQVPAVSASGAPASAAPVVTPVVATAASAPVSPGAAVAVAPAPAAAAQKSAPPAKPPAGSSPFVIGGSR